MPKFIAPPREKIRIRNQEFSNFAVNIELVTGLEKTTFRVYSDGFWVVYEPIIKFHGTEIIWHFGESQDAVRDSLYDSMMLEYGGLTA